MGLTVDTIGVDIVARIDKLEAGLRMAEARVDASANRMKAKQGKLVQFTQTEQGLVKIVAAMAIVDRLGAALNAAFDSAESHIRKVQSGTESMWKATQGFVGSIADAIPGVSQLYDLFSKIYGVIDGSGEELYRLTEREKKLNAEAGKRQGEVNRAQGFASARLGEFAQSHVDALGGDKTQAGRDARYEAEMNKLRDRMQELYIAAREMLGRNPEAGRKAFADLYQYGQDRKKVLEKDRLGDAMAASFDTIGTAFGAMKVANRGGAAAKEQEKAAKDTAKHTKRTADGIDKLLRSGGAIIAFS